MENPINGELTKIVDKMANIGESIDHRLRRLAEASREAIIRSVEWSADLGERQSLFIERGSDRFFRHFH